MDVVATVFFVQDLAISWHEDGNGIRQEKHLRGHRSRQTVSARIADTGVFQIHGVHQMMQGNVSVAAGEAGKNRREESGKGNQGIAAEGTEEQIKPNHVRLEFADRVQDVN